MLRLVGLVAALLPVIDAQYVTISSAAKHATRSAPNFLPDAALAGLHASTQSLPPAQLPTLTKPRAWLCPATPALRHPSWFTCQPASTQPLVEVEGVARLLALAPSPARWSRLRLVK